MRPGRARPPAIQAASWGRAGRRHLLLRLVVVGVVAFAILWAISWLSFQATAVPVSVSHQRESVTVTVDGVPLRARLTGTPTTLTFVSPTAHEVAIDGTDSLNNFWQDPTYLARENQTPYGRFQEWMRDGGSYSGWEVRQDADSGAAPAAAKGAANVTWVPIAASGTVTARLMRPEAPAQVTFQCGNALCGQLTIDRNNRAVTLRALDATGATLSEHRSYFPNDPGPFVAELVYALDHVLLWALALAGVALGLHALIVTLLGVQAGMPSAGVLSIRAEGLTRTMRRLEKLPLPRLVARDGWDVAALGIALAFFAAALWIATVQYQAMPHILDASAYYFQAKIFASGRLSATPPSDAAAFQGPFMVIHDGRWFSQYAPMTSLVLALGMRLGVPQLVEPLLGGAAAWGIYRIGRLLYTPQVAILALALAALSPFSLYLAGSYLSHTVALFFATYFVLFLLRFRDSHATRDIVVAAVCAGGLLLTRELSAVLIGVGATAYVLGGALPELWPRRGRVWRPLAVGTGIALGGVLAYLLYNRALTGSALVSPRTLFFPGDRYGFGAGIGFYGQHTLAAGLVVLDQLLSALLVDLYGWPFYLTLAFIPLVSLRRDRASRWDVFCLALLVVLIGAQAGYFYHGIYLGPRYLYEALPFLVLLTARGMTALVAVAVRVARWRGGQRQRTAARVAVGVVVVALFACNLVYYLPRQVQLFDGFTGLPRSIPVDVRTVYAFHPANALIVTNDWYIYNYVLWPMNAPALNGAQLYAYAPDPAAISRLKSEYPGRTLYQLLVVPGGAVRFVQL